ncbi:MAG: 3-dehydroquinate synthase family protein [Pyrinomonadaceae bacterium]
MEDSSEINIRIPGKTQSYPITVERGIIAQVGPRLDVVLPGATRRVLAVSNAKVFALYGRAVMASLDRSRFTASSWLMGDGERFKSWRTLEQAITAFGGAGLERPDAVIALGGGVVGDLTGLAAELYLRGIALVQIPTTLLAQIDSSVGGKTGINIPAGKNLVGTFHHPVTVLIDPDTLRTLPPRELTAGWCEAVKQAAVADRRLFLRTQRLLESGSDGLEAEDLARIIADQCALKAKIVAGDARESWDRTDSRSRRILNFGHTVGHALETATSYRRFRHGEAVGVGMLVAGEIAKNIGILPTDELELLRSAILLAGRLPRTRDLDPADILALVKRDKKSVGGSLKWILLERVGRARIVDGREIPPAAVRAALRTVLYESN